MMYKRSLSICLSLILSIASSLHAQKVESFDLNNDWSTTIERLAPSHATVEVKLPRKILVFDLFTGYNHWVTDHTTEVIRILGDKSGAYEVDITKDIYAFEEPSLKKYDAVVLNNNCSVGPRRDLFMDVLDKDDSLTDEQRQAKAKELEENLLQFIAKGKGLIVMHGAIVMQNNSEAFGKMCGGSFDYHPPQQELTLHPCEPDHPLLASFGGETFTHIDEPYLFSNAYFDKEFRPLLYMDTNKLTGKKKEIADNIRYTAWIKPHGKGRVFYCSPSHNAQSFERPELLKFILNGVQYATGDLKCDDKAL